MYISPYVHMYTCTYILIYLHTYTHIFMYLRKQPVGKCSPWRSPPPHTPPTTAPLCGMHRMCSTTEYVLTSTPLQPQLDIIAHKDRPDYLTVPPRFHALPIAIRLQIKT